MKYETVDPRELASALADGELRGEEFAEAMEAIAASEEARAVWQAYHLVGDVLRSGERAAIISEDAAFLARLRPRLAPPGRMDASVAKVGIPARLPASANDSSLRWKVMAGVGVLAAVAVLGWHMVDVKHPLSDQAVELASQAPTATVVLSGGEAAPQVVIRDPRLDELLAAHQQLGGTSALQMPAGFLRNATFEQPAR